MARRYNYNRSIGGQYLAALFIFGSGFLSTFLTNCEAAALPDIFSDVNDVVTGRRGVTFDAKNGITLGPTNEEIVLYSLIGLGIGFLIIGLCFCCCRRREVHVHTSVMHANPNSSVGYRK